MNPTEMIRFIRKCEGSCDAQYVLEWIERNTIDETTREIVQTFFDAIEEE